MSHEVLHSARSLVIAITAVGATVAQESLIGTFRPGVYNTGTSAGNYAYRLDIDVEDHLQVDLNPTMGTARVHGSFIGALEDRPGNLLGNGVASLDLEFTGLEISPSLGAPGNPIRAIGIEGVSSSLGTLDLDFDWSDPAHADSTIALPVYGGFANVNANHADFGDIAGTRFNFLLREDGNFDIWVKSVDGYSFEFQGEDSKMHGDIHAYLNVPEPGSATMALLVGTFCLMVRRR